MKVFYEANILRRVLSEIHHAKEIRRRIHHIELTRAEFADFRGSVKEEVVTTATGIRYIEFGGLIIREAKDG